MVMIEEDSDIKMIRFNGSNKNSSIRIVVDVEELTVAAAAAKVKRRWMTIMEESKRGEDPVEKLGEDLMREILGLLDARSLALTLLVSRSWCSLASSDSLWSPLCEQLWIGKAHIPRCSKVPGLSKLASYSRAIVDSKRVRVMSDDLCDHAWAFHFGEAAPDYWKDLDPYWGSIGRPMHRHFHPDGSISADIEDTVWGGHESSYCIVTNIYENGEIGENYVRINCWPRLTVSRREDWGWEMSNSVCAYSSVPDASKGETGPVFDFKDHFF